MASAVSTAGSSASSLLYFICTETASLSRHAAPSAAGHQSSLRRVFAFGNIFLGQMAATFLSEQDDAYAPKTKCTEAKEEDETNEWTPAEEYKQRERDMLTNSVVSVSSTGSALLLSAVRRKRLH